MPQNSASKYDQAAQAKQLAAFLGEYPLEVVADLVSYMLSLRELLGSIGGLHLTKEIDQLLELIENQEAFTPERHLELGMLLTRRFGDSILVWIKGTELVGIGVRDVSGDERRRIVADVLDRNDADAFLEERPPVASLAVLFGELCNEVLGVRPDYVASLREE